jgi:putative DNA primase/helicase
VHKRSRFSNFAQHAAKAGFRVFPLQPGTKLPAIKGWQTKATTRAGMVNTFWMAHSNANIAIATGGKPNLFVFDIDGEEGKQSLADLERAHGSIPETVMVRTPHGTHFYFHCPQRLRNSVGTLAPGLDGRAEGGYVVGAGSVNGEGVRYRYAKGHSPDEVEIAVMPAWLIALLRKEPRPEGGPSNYSHVDAGVPSTYAATALQGEAEAVRSAPKGTRNNRLNTAAFAMGQLVGAGEIGRAAVEGALSEAAQAAGLEGDEIQATIASGLGAGQAHPRDRNGDQPPQSNDLLLTDLAELGENDTDNAQRLVRRSGNHVRFVPERKQWYAFDGQIWQEDTSRQRFVFAQNSARLIASEADLLGDDRRADRRRWARQSLGAGAVKRALEMAQPHATRSLKDFDTDPWLINVQNGTLDLRTGDLRAFDSADHLTRLAGTAFEPDAECVRFKQFLREIFAGDTELIRFVQRYIGYTLTGSTIEQCFLFLQGPGRNGKSTLVQILQQMLGPYALSTPTDTLLAKHGSSSTSNDVARLHGARMVAAIESNPNRQLDEAMIKQITGGDRIAARFLYAEHFEYTPEFKLWFVANHPPRLRSTDDALWRRILVLPFTVEIPKDQVDPNLSAALQTELPGILAWAVRGCRRWQRHRLQPPERVIAATKRYRKEVDHVRRFLQECVMSTADAVTRSNIIYEHYERWCAEKGEHGVSMRALAARLTEAGFTPSRIPGSGARAWRGIELRGN